MTTYETTADVYPYMRLIQNVCPNRWRRKKSLLIFHHINTETEFWREIKSNFQGKQFVSSGNSGGNKQWLVKSSSRNYKLKFTYFFILLWLASVEKKYFVERF